MRRCWRADPAQRPTFSELASILDRFLQLVADYTELTMTLPASEADPENEDVNITDHEGGRVTSYYTYCCMAVHGFHAYLYTTASFVNHDCS